MGQKIFCKISTTWAFCISMIFVNLEILTVPELFQLKKYLSKQFQSPRLPMLLHNVNQHKVNVT
jgi:hypothetical protein